MTKNPKSTTAPAAPGATTATQPPAGTVPQAAKSTASVALPPEVDGVSCVAVGMKRLPNARGFAAYSVTIEGDRVTSWEVLSEDPGHPVLTSQDAAFNLVRRRAVEEFMLEAPVTEEHG